MTAFIGMDSATQIVYYQSAIPDPTQRRIISVTLSGTQRQDITDQIGWYVKVLREPEHCGNSIIASSRSIMGHMYCVENYRKFSFCVNITEITISKSF